MQQFANFHDPLPPGIWYDLCCCAEPLVLIQIKLFTIRLKPASGEVPYEYELESVDAIACELLAPTFI